MKYFTLLFSACILFSLKTYSQSVGISDGANQTIDATAVLDVQSTTSPRKGMLIPRMTSVQRTAITNPANGLLVFDTDSASIWCYNSTWREILKGGNSTDRIRIESDGSLFLEGAATVWDDIRVSLQARGTNASADYVQFLSSTLFAYRFSGTADNSLYFEVQMPHTWKEGSTIYPHVHWASSGTSTADVTWGLDYQWKNINDDFGNTSSNITRSIAASGTAGRQQINNISETGISGTGKKISSVLICRLYRSGADANAEPCFLLSFDIHYQFRHPFPMGRLRYSNSPALHLIFTNTILPQQAVNG